jgi:hypothetical protein
MLVAKTDNVFILSGFEIVARVRKEGLIAFRSEGNVFANTQEIDR